MLTARWQIDARFGHKQTVIDMLRKWEREVGSKKAGTGNFDFKMLNGSVGSAQGDDRSRSYGGKPRSARTLLRGDRQNGHAQAMG